MKLSRSNCARANASSTPWLSPAAMISRRRESSSWKRSIQCSRFSRFVIMMSCAISGEPDASRVVSVKPLEASVASSGQAALPNATENSAEATRQRQVADSGDVTVVLRGVHEHRLRPACLRPVPTTVSARAVSARLHRGTTTHVLPRNSVRVRGVDAERLLARHRVTADEVGVRRQRVARPAHDVCLRAAGVGDHGALLERGRDLLRASACVARIGVAMMTRRRTADSLRRCRLIDVDGAELARLLQRVTRAGGPDDLRCPAGPRLLQRRVPIDPPMSPSPMIAMRSTRRHSVASAPCRQRPAAAPAAHPAPAASCARMRRTVSGSESGAATRSAPMAGWYRAGTTPAAILRRQDWRSQLDASQRAAQAHMRDALPQRHAPLPQSWSRAAANKARSFASATARTRR